jgi:hypothetical protein
MEEIRHSSFVESELLTNNEAGGIFEIQLGYKLSLIIPIRQNLSREGGVKSPVFSEDKIAGLPKSGQS